MKRIAPIVLSLLLLAAALTFAKTADASDAPPCTYAVPEATQSYVSHLYDGDPFSTLTLHKDEVLSLQFKDAAPAALYLDFYQLQIPFNLLYLDADGIVLQRETLRPSSCQMLLPIEREGVKEVRIVPTARDLSISECRPVEPDFAMPFPDTGVHADVLMVLDRPGDELELFGGLIAKLSGEHGLSVQIVYVTQSPGFESHQCMELLKAMGVKRQPVFGTVPDTNTRSIYTARGFLGDEKAVQRNFTVLIRNLTPTLLFTLDPVQNENRIMRAAIAEAVLKAAQSAADETKFSDTPAHTVQKVYTLSEAGETQLDFDVPLYAYDGVTAAALADRLYETYTERRVYRRIMPAVLKLDLAQSACGADQDKNDVFEHLSLDLFADYQSPTPTPSPTPEPTDTPEPTLAPTPKPTATPEESTPAPVPTEVPDETPPTPGKNRGFIRFLPLIIGFAISLVLFFLPKKHPNRRIQLICLLPLAIGLALTVLALTNVIPLGREKAPVAEVATPTEAPAPSPTAAPTEAPTPEPTATPTEAPTPEPTEEPTPTPDPNDAYFLDGEGEQFESDFENGHWWYKNNVLAIDVREVHTDYLGTGPLVYYVADIRMRTYSSYRSGLKNDYVQPYRFARQDGAVLAVTGDCLTNENDQKGCLIRKGVFYCDRHHASALVIDPGSMSMHVVHAADTDARVLMDNGVRDTYSFGPILVENGEISGETMRHRVTHVNPRAGVGMVEPGHWVAIVTDGRQYGYSMSISLEYFAQMFLDYGCTVAFNMDGGSSGGIVFMGEMLNRHLAPHTDDIQRPWLDALEFGYTENVPDPDQPTKYNGYHH